MSCRSFIVALLLGLASVAVTADDSFDYQLHDLEGRLHKASDQQSKWLVINFWATWCALLLVLRTPYIYDLYIRQSKSPVANTGNPFLATQQVLQR
jgi:hypothetical protein